MWPYFSSSGLIHKIFLQLFPWKTKLTLAKTQVQAKDPSDQEVHRHLDREGIPGEAGWTKGHLQLPRLGPGGDQHGGGAFVFDNLCQFFARIGHYCQKCALLAKSATFTAL